MSQLEQIRARDEQQPAYDNTFRDWQLWYALNQARLLEHYGELTPYVEWPDEHDFIEFALRQFDVAMAEWQERPVCSLLRRQAG